ncbi:MAG: nuclear transport factor 2 family protein, partial [Polyangiaceae bacterium]
MMRRARVEEFVGRIERGEFLEVMPEFYAEDCTAQENNDPPRVGLAAMIANERGALQRMKFKHIEAKSVVVEGDRAVIHYIFEMEIIGKGTQVRLEEIAWQEWKNDKIVQERYFYDP